MTEDELKKRLSEKFTRHGRRCDEFLAVIPTEDRKGKSAWRMTYDFTDGIKIYSL